MNENDIKRLWAQATVRKPNYLGMVTLYASQNDIAEHYTKFIKTIVPASPGEVEFDIEIVNSVSAGLDFDEKFSHGRIVLNPSFTLLYDHVDELFKDKETLKQLKDSIKQVYNCDVELWALDSKIAFELISPENVSITAKTLGDILKGVCKNLKYKCTTSAKPNGSGAIVTTKVYKESDM